MKNCFPYLVFWDARYDEPKPPLDDCIFSTFEEAKQTIIKRVATLLNQPLPTNETEWEAMWRAAKPEVSYGIYRMTQDNTSAEGPLDGRISFDFTRS